MLKQFLVVLEIYLPLGYYHYYYITTHLFFINSGPAEWRSLHPDGLGAIGLHHSPTETPPLHDIRQEAALHRGVPVLRRGHESRADRWNTRVRLSHEAACARPTQSGYVTKFSAAHATH